MKKIIFIALFIANNALAYQISGRVVGVTDGDTVKILDAQNTQHKIRLSDIDAPEAGQPFGQRAKQFLSDLAFSKQAIAECSEKDRYERDVCTLFVNGFDVNKELVAQGYAWVYEKYNRRDDLPYLQQQTKMARAGLWSAPEAEIINPSDWRKGQKNIQKQVQKAAQQQAQSADYTCGTKTVCRQMQSCEEANFYLKQCGVSRLDGDKDGVPCESICK